MIKMLFSFLVIKPVNQLAFRMGPSISKFIAKIFGAYAVFSVTIRFKPALRTRSSGPRPSPVLIRKIKQTECGGQQHICSFV